MTKEDLKEYVNNVIETLDEAKKEILRLVTKNAELEQQIEKMRNFENCDYQLHIIDCPIFKSGGHISCKKCPHWILQDTDNEQKNDKWHRQM